jgi:hypothetical protein
MIKPKAIIVSVDYSDYLSITLSYNIHHFSDIVIVTTAEDTESQEVAKANNCNVHVSNSFYENGAVFNKWKPLEEGLDVLGRDGWLCIMDADVLWPNVVDLTNLTEGYLYTPFRRMFTNMNIPIPKEPYWYSFPRHHVTKDFSGYTQVFHASDPVLHQGYWHQTNWKHAGGADTFFQAKWSPDRKVRPNFEVLHLGDAGRNWCGRVTDYLDGTTPDASKERQDSLNRFMQGRRQASNRADKFKAEKY